MSYNKSLDFLNMIKNSPSTDKKYASSKSDSAAANSHKAQVPANAASKNSTNKSVISLKRTLSRHNPDRKIAVIDTETNWNNEVMSIGIVLADMDTYKCVDAKYLIIDPEYKKGGMYSDVLTIVKSIPQTITTRDAAMQDICNYLKSNDTRHLFAYNARFDHGLLTELHEFEWFDIMRLAAYKQFNHAIPANAELCKSGRLKRGYSVESILQMLSSDYNYHETHNAVFDAMDELKIMELLGHSISSYECARL